MAWLVGDFGFVLFAEASKPIWPSPAHPEPILRPFYAAAFAALQPTFRKPEESELQKGRYTGGLMGISAGLRDISAGLTGISAGLMDISAGLADIGSPPSGAKSRNLRSKWHLQLLSHT
jgi:hypothetical protein